MATIKLTNSVGIDSTSLRIGIDTSNVLFSGTINTAPRQFTAPADCWVFADTNGSDSNSWTIDGEATTQRTGAVQGRVRTFFLRENQVLKLASGNANLYVKAFGLK